MPMSRCYISLTTQRISIKFDIGEQHYVFLEWIYFWLILSVVIRTSHESQIKLLILVNMVQRFNRGLRYLTRPRASPGLPTLPALLTNMHNLN